MLHISCSLPLTWLGCCMLIFVVIILHSIILVMITVMILVITVMVVLDIHMIILAPSLIKIHYNTRKHYKFVVMRNYENTHFPPSWMVYSRSYMKYNTSSYMTVANLSKGNTRLHAMIIMAPTSIKIHYNTRKNYKFVVMRNYKNTHFPPSWMVYSRSYMKYNTSSYMATKYTFSTILNGV